jgi:hypothetical protein
VAGDPKLLELQQAVTAAKEGVTGARAAVNTAAQNHIQATRQQQETGDAEEAAAAAPAKASADLAHCQVISNVPERCVLAGLSICGLYY